MAAYQYTSASTSPEQQGRPVRRFGRRALAQAKGTSFYGGLAWFIISIVTLSYLSSLSDHWLELAQTRSGSAALYFRPCSPDTITFWIPTILAMIVLNLRMKAVTKLATLILLFASMVGSSAMAMTGYDVVTSDRVLIHSPLPWHRDVRFSLADARVTAKGCQYWHTRSGTHRRIIFQVQGGPGGEQTVNLGDAIGDNLGHWLAVMRGYDDRSLPLAAAAGINTPHDPRCMQFWSTDLDEQQQAELSRLLS